MTTAEAPAGGPPAYYLNMLSKHEPLTGERETPSASGDTYQRENAGHIISCSNADARLALF
ncbi:hypothetical protein GCM10027040_04320 [Halomonas shantousis]